MESAVVYQSVVLELGEGKYWVAKTRNAEKYISFLDSEENTPPKWVQKWGFREVLEISDEDSRDLLVRLAKEHGVENVRGNAFHAVELSEYQKQRLNALVNGTPEPPKPKRKRAKKKVTLKEPTESVDLHKLKAYCGDDTVCLQ